MFEVCVKLITNLSFLDGGGSGGDHKRRKENLTFDSGGNREIPVKNLVIVRA